MYDLKMIKIILSFLIVTILAVSSAAFGTHTRLQTSPNHAVRNGASGMVMRTRICDLLGKRPNRQARVITFSHKRVRKVQNVNLQTVRYFSDDLKRRVKLRLSTKGMKTVTKYGGIDAAARKFKVDLTKY